MIHVLTYLVSKSLDSTTYKCPIMYPVQIQSGLQMLPFLLSILPDLQNRELQKGFHFYWIDFFADVSRG